MVQKRLDRRLELPSYPSYSTNIFCEVSTSDTSAAGHHLLSVQDSVLPGIAFSLDLIETTQQYGVAEVLISSFMAAFVFSIFGAQPLTIAGVTGGHNMPV
jgi:hypothetical protein